MDGRWLAIDADMMGKPFTHQLYQRFGWAGIGVWVAFLCACKRSRNPGSIRFLNESDASAQLGILGWELVDTKGENWDLTDFWTFTGRKKQTKRTSRGREMNVRATHWGRWQETARTQNERDRKSRWAAQNRVDTTSRTRRVPRREVDADIDIDSDTPLPPTGGLARRSAFNSKDTPPNPNPRPPIPDWQPDPEPASSIDQNAVATLRANPSGKHP